MVAKAGDALPDVQLDELVGGAPTSVSLRELFPAGTKGVLFAVPGAFTPGCSKTHLPGYIADHEALKAAGASVVACVSVNDPFVMGAWGEAHGAEGKVRMLADTRGELTRALGVGFDAASKLGNERSRRYSAVIEDGTIKTLNLESTGEMSCSLANQILPQLQQ